MMMKTGLISLLLLMFMSCDKTLLIANTDVPMENVCGGQSEYDCRATGFESKNPKYRVFSKERPDADGKGGYSGLGRSDDITQFHNTYNVIDILEDEMIRKVTEIDIDLKTDKVSKLVTDLNAKLEVSELNADAQLKIKLDFEKNLNSYMKVEAYFETFTIKSEIQDKLRDAKDGIETEQRFKVAFERLHKKNRPLIRQIIVIREKYSFEEDKSIKSILEGIIDANIATDSEKAKATTLVSGLNNLSEIGSFKSNFERSTIYSYGYFSEDWMYDSE